MSGWGRMAVAAAAAAVAAVASAGAASADNSNSNTNNNDVTQPASIDGESSSASEKTNWPPTNLDWPPQEVMAGGVGESNKKGSDNESSTAKPIVMPSGQSPPEESATPTTSETPKPIVPVSTP